MSWEMSLRSSKPSKWMWPRMNPWMSLSNTSRLIWNKANVIFLIPNFDRHPFLLGLWAVVNNAGVVPECGPDDWLMIDSYKVALDVNTIGVMRVTKARLIQKSWLINEDSRPSKSSSKILVVASSRWSRRQEEFASWDSARIQFQNTLLRPTSTRLGSTTFTDYVQSLVVGKNCDHLEWFVRFWNLASTRQVWRKMKCTWRESRIRGARLTKIRNCSMAKHSKKLVSFWHLVFISTFEL